MYKTSHRPKISKTKRFLKNLISVIAFVCSLVAGYFIGVKIMDSHKKPETTEKKVFYKKDLTIAIDNKNNIILMNKQDGTLVIFEDSVGYEIFNFYANSLWGQHKSGEKPN